MKALSVILLMLFLLMACAHPEEAQRVYYLNVYANCYATDCTIYQNVTVTVSADVKKDQTADAKADISPTVDITP